MLAGGQKICINDEKHFPFVLQAPKCQTSTVETRFNDPEGTRDFWSLNPNVVKSNF